MCSGVFSESSRAWTSAPASKQSDTAAGSAFWKNSQVPQSSHEGCCATVEAAPANRPSSTQPTRAGPSKSCLISPVRHPFPKRHGRHQDGKVDEHRRSPYREAPHLRMHSAALMTRPSNADSRFRPGGRSRRTQHDHIYRTYYVCGLYDNSYIFSVSTSKSEQVPAGASRLPVRPERGLQISMAVGRSF